MERFERWDSGRHFFNRHEWIAALPTFCANLAPLRGSSESALVRHVIERQLKTIVAEHQKCLKQLPGKYGRAGLRELVEPMLGLLEAGALAQDSGLQDRVRSLLGIAPSPLLTWTTEVLRSAKQKLSSETFRACGLGPVLSLCQLTLNRLLVTPARASDDWSIEAPIGGHCALCKRFAAFLASHTQARMDWPLAKDKRAHVHQLIDELELPVRHETLREGRPYTLALTKTRALFEEAAAEREAWRQDADWISAELHAVELTGHPAA